MLSRRERFALPNVASVILLFSVIFILRNDLTAAGLQPRANPSIQSRNASIEGNFRIAALRVQFQQDDAATTTGDGQFDLSTASAGSDTLIDPPPHNKAYFQSQILAVHNYFSRVSDGRVTLENSRVFPEEAKSTYTLDEPMLTYSRSFTDSLRNIHWANLVYDSYLKARDDIDFQDYSTVVIFHAGVGQDFSIPLDDTPFDIQSAYLDSTFLHEELPTEQYQTLRNAGIHDVLILPETQNQLDVKLGVTGTFSLLFGSRLGLPSLYNTSDGSSVIGKFGLMDQGSANANGVAPAPPSAWTKIYAGWAQPAVASADGEYSVRTHEVTGAEPTIIKVPINDTEYYLIENRERQTRDSELKQFIINADTLFVQRQNGVITQVEEYDAGLPGAGLLIWHIDESVISDSLANDAINNNPERRGVDLEEGDGAQDIGQYYGALSGGRENGWFFDFWFAKNAGFFHLNPDYKTDADSTVGFTPETHPGTVTNSGAYSGIKITQIPDAAPVMSFNLQYKRNIPGLPFSRSGGIKNLTTLNTSSGFVLVGTNRTPALADTFLIYSEGSAQNGFAEFAIDNPNTSSAQIGSIAAYNLDEDNVRLIYSDVIAGENPLTSISALTVNNISLDISANATRIASVPGAPVTPVIVSNGNVILATDTDTAYSYTENGILNWKYDLADSIKSVAVNPDGNVIIGTSDGLYGVQDGSIISLITGRRFESIVLTGNNNLFALSEGQVLSADELELISGLPYSSINTEINGTTTVPRQILATDLDRDGEDEVLALLSDQQNHWMLAAWNQNSTLVNNYPVYLSGDFSDGSMSLADLDNDKQPEQIITDNSGKIYAFTLAGNLLPHFPIDAGSEFSESIWISTTMSGRSGMFSLGADEVVNGYYPFVDKNIASGTVYWTGASGNPQNTRFMKNVGETVEPGNNLVIHRAYIYPNPVKSNHATIRVEADNADKIDVSIYDFSGRLVALLTESIQPGEGVHEFPWETGSLPSGVYFGNVRVNHNGSEESKTIKIAIIR